MPRRRITLLAVTALLALSPAPLQGQQRPELSAEADTNSWEAYFDEGTRWIGKANGRADEAFLWASRLDPSRAEPYFARYATFWLADLERFEKYLSYPAEFERDTSVARAFRERERAMTRNPFVHQGLIILAYDQLPGRWREGALSRAWIAYGQANMPLAILRLAQAERAFPDRIDLRVLRAGAFANTGNADSAIVEMSAALEQLRARDRAVVVKEYESKELLEYAIGLAELHLRRRDAARDAFGRAALENPAFAPAHVKLGELALLAGDVSTAVSEMTLAADAAPDDPLAQMALGRALVRSGKRAEGILRLRRTVELAPYWAEARLQLASALDEAGEVASAASEYWQFVDRALRGDARAATVTARLVALGAGTK